MNCNQNTKKLCKHCGSTVIRKSYSVIGKLMQVGEDDGKIHIAHRGNQNYIYFCNDCNEKLDQETIDMLENLGGGEK